MRIKILLAALLFLSFCSYSQNVGIGTTSPAARLHVADSNVLFTGPVTIPAYPLSNPPVQGPGTRMMWYPQRAAFRTGSVTGGQWNKDSIGEYSFAAGRNNKAMSFASVAIGDSTIASGYTATALGAWTVASNTVATAMGESTLASGYASTAMGESTKASGYASTSMGNETTASGLFAVATGNQSTASGDASFAAGDSAAASGHNSAAIGFHAIAAGTGSFSAGENTIAAGNHAVALGLNSAALQANAFAIGETDTAAGTNSIAIGGSLNQSTGDYSVSIGTFNKALGYQSLAMGYNAIAASYNSISIGLSNTASGNGAVAIGIGNAAAGSYSFAGGISANSYGTGAVSLGNSTTSSGNSSAAFGYLTMASGDYSTATGISNKASGTSSFAAGNGTTASGANTASFGGGTIAKSANSLVIGKYNDSTVLNSLFEIGIGAANNNRKNALTVLNTGQVGIGVTNPYGLFNVGTGTVRFEGIAVSGTGSPALSIGGYGSVIVDAPGFVGGRFFISENGNIGIGKSNPSQKLEVKYSNSGSSYWFNTNLGVESFGDNYIGVLTSNMGETGILFGNSQIGNDGGVVYRPVNTQTDPRTLYFLAGSVIRMKIYNNGNAWLQGSLSQNSDSRFKKNISPLSNTLASLEKINGYTYNWNEEKLDTALQIGLIAQEVQKVYPQLVKLNPEGQLSVNYIGLIPVLLESIKELAEKNAKLEDAVKKLQQ